MNVNIGAVSKQDNKPVAYISKILNKIERNYSITDRELLAALWAIKKLKYILYNKLFVLVTNHKTIETIKIKTEFVLAKILCQFKRLKKNFILQ